MSHPKVVAAVRGALDPLLAGPAPRIMIGITGPPAAGKSTLATTLVTVLRRHLGEWGAVAVPMDGFHLSNGELERLGLADRKGAPDTFDAAGFVHLLRRLREPAEEIVYAPAYSRVLHESIGGVIPVPLKTRVIVIEGNYLLLPTGHWAQVRPLLDLACYLDAPRDTRVDSLLRRQHARGLGPEQAYEWVHGSDELNAELIANTRRHADLVIARPA